jgi:hypothetical protein
MMIRFVLTALCAFVFVACAPIEAPAQENNVRISLTRTVCYGHCPAYTVSISGDGAVSYEGRQFVNVRGAQTATIAPEEVARLVERFDAAGFENLRSEYRGEVTDHPTFTLVFERDGRRKAVVDYAGSSVGMPRVVRDLQDEVDRVAGTARWVLRDGQPVIEMPQP